MQQTRQEATTVIQARGEVAKGAGIVQVLADEKVLPVTSFLPVKCEAGPWHPLRGDLGGEMESCFYLYVGRVEKRGEEIRKEGKKCYKKVLSKKLHV